MSKDDQTAIRIEPGSYKDPKGNIFYHEDKVYRLAVSDAAQFYQTLVKSRFFRGLIESHLFIPTWLANSDNIPFPAKKGNKITCFEHERLDFISYPYEWPFEMLKDAAMHTLDLQHLLLKKEFSLKDATPYNIQFRFTQALFIDLYSIENISRNGIWIAYNQFCQMFLYPLLKFICNYSDPKEIFLSHMDGLTLDEIVQSLGFSPFFKYKMLTDYLIPAVITKLKKYKAASFLKNTVSIDRESNISAEIQLHLIRRLIKILKKMRYQNRLSEWKNYSVTCSYYEEDYLIKSKFIEKVLEINEIKRVLDLGCNTGNYSIIAAKKGCYVVALDSDHDCVNSLYIQSKEKKYTILPLWMDISNPSPAIGWRNTERPDFISRYKSRFDCVFALALIHHMLITNRIPLSEIATFFRQLTSRFLVVEYVSPKDKMFRELVKYRNEDFNSLNMKGFEETMLTQFTIIEKSELIDKQRQMERCLYLMECKI